MTEANEKADKIQITLEDLSRVLNEYPEFLKPLKVAAVARIKANSEKKEAKDAE